MVNNSTNVNQSKYHLSSCFIYVFKSYFHILVSNMISMSDDIRVI